MGEIVLFIPKPNPDRDHRTMEQQAIGMPATKEIVPYNGEGIDGMPYCAPDTDSA